MLGWVPLAIAALSVSQVQVTARDTVTVGANNAPYWGPHPELVERVRIGAIDGDPAYTFGSVSAISENEHGDIWVADATVAVVRRFDSLGVHLGNIGRKGQGPGEFAGGMPMGMGRLRDGRMVVFDTNAHRISFFTPEGLFVGSRSAPIQCITSRRPSLVVDTSDVLSLRTCIDGADAWIMVDTTGQVVDTVLVPPLDTDAAPARRLPFGNMAPFIAKTVSARSPHGYMVVGRTSSYAVHRPIRDGRMVRIWRNWTPIQVRSEEKRRLREYYRTRQERFGQAGVGADRPFRAIPDEKPPFWALQVDHDGRVWVARHQAAYFREETPGERSHRESYPFVPATKIEWREQLVVDVLEPNGRFLGTLELPHDQATVGFATGTRVWLVETGEYGEQYVVRYELQVDHSGSTR